MKHNYKCFNPYKNKCTNYSNEKLLYYILLKISKDRFPNSKYNSLYLCDNNQTTITYVDTIFVVDDEDVKVIQDLAYKLDEEIETNNPWLIMDMRV